MPYLDQGEFYSEFGDFDVTITLPENYVVGATGTLQTESEFEFLNKKVEESNRILKILEGKNWPERKDTFPKSAEKLKTLNYTAQNVHDFAWFADKRFYVQKSSVTLASGKEVDTWAMFSNKETKIWMRGTEYLNRSVKFYSDNVGEYPWPHATAVQSALSAGGGMEYPMITVIGLSGSAKLLDIVITHEVGHNWFYGILGSNERVYPWMDEGLNSYIEKRYTEKYYGAPQNIGEFLGGIGKMIEGDQHNVDYTAYQLCACSKRCQAVATHSEQLTNFNYGVSAYMLPAALFTYLESYLGTDMMNQAMNAYYEEWKFKHPGPKDIQTTFERETGKDLSWFFQDLIEKEIDLDYAIGKYKDGKVNIENKGTVKGPFSVSGMKDGQIVHTQWYEGMEGKQELDFKDGDYDVVRIDAQKVMVETVRKNNSTKRPFRIKPLTAINNPDKSTLGIAPVLGWNNYDKTMAGLAFHNLGVPGKKFEWMLAPMYGFGSKDPNFDDSMYPLGFAEFRYHLYPKKGFVRKVTLGTQYKSFNKFYNFKFDYHELYRRVVPNLSLEFRNKNPRSKIKQTIDARALFIYDEEAKIELVEIDSNRVATYMGNKILDRQVYNLNYNFKNNRILHPYSFKVGVTGEDYLKLSITDSLGNVIDFRESYVRATVEAKYKYTYDRKGKGVYFRVFGGAFLHNSDKDFGRYPLYLAENGERDYYYDNLYLGRSEQSGIFTQQVGNSGGGFKLPVMSEEYPVSNDFVLALNVTADLPVNTPVTLRPYFDLGYYQETRPSVLNNPSDVSEQFIWAVGLELDLFKIAKIYIPFQYSPELQSKVKSLGEDKFWRRITFSIDLDRLNPFDLTQDIMN